MFFLFIIKVTLNQTVRILKKSFQDHFISFKMSSYSIYKLNVIRYIIKRKKKHENLC
jgi:hypothetical protein